jgi:CRISPR/Cas system-associated exonuclease Cas4 (RecB family)
MFESVQLDMFEGVSQSEVTSSSKIEWSYSRRSLLEQCPRRYYYQYYGSAGRTAKGEPQKETLRFLRALSNRYLLAGKILHSVIREYFNKKLTCGVEWAPEESLNWTQWMYRRAQQNSQVLLEFYYDLPDAEELYIQSEAVLLNAVTNFIDNPALLPFRQGGSQQEARIEKRFRVNIGRILGIGQADLVYPDGSKIVIVDWKMRPGAANEILQLAFYALWATKEYGCSLDDIALYKVHLSTNDIVPLLILPENLERTKARIIQDVEIMQMLERYGKEANARAFTPCGHALVCALCQFQAVCPKEP